MCLTAVVLSAAAFAIVPSRAADLTTLVSFCTQTNCTDGKGPSGTLIADADGNLFGTTGSGGANNRGTVFEIAKTADGYASTPTILYSFCGEANCTDGASPSSGLIADAEGNLFGTTISGGASNEGTVFEIVKIGSGYSSTPDILVSFCVEADCIDGMEPTGVIADVEGNLFGTTAGGGGAGSGGTVFEIMKTRSGYASKPTILYRFCAQPDCADGAGPAAPPTIDAKGNLLGTTAFRGGGDSIGTVFEIAKTGSGYASAVTILHRFCEEEPECADGAEPLAPLTIDADGNLFGTTFGDRHPSTVFEIPKTGGGYGSAVVLYRFCDMCDEKAPVAGLLLDAVGNLFGTTCGYRCFFAGTVFELPKTGSGYAATATFLYHFCAQPNCVDGFQPHAGLIANAKGDLFGTTSGFAISAGTLFEITDSGFVSFFAGTPGKPNCRGKTHSALLKRFGGIVAAAASLHYTGVDALQGAIAEFCEA
jgi:uncharacterized repeat protein (TIGR03803 family)